MRTSIEVLRLTVSPEDQCERFLASLDAQVDQIERYIKALIDEPESFSDPKAKATVEVV